MKKIINGKMYNTETAEVVDTHVDKLHEYVDEQLYRKKNGEFFLHGEGDWSSCWAKMVCYDDWTDGEDILPLSEDQAKTWILKHNSCALVNPPGSYHSMLSEMREHFYRPPCQSAPEWSMKKTINGKLYDPKTAELLGYCTSGLRSDASGSIGYLYRKADGEFFLLGAGNDNSRWFRRVRRFKDILPMSENETKDWVEKHGDPLLYETLFGPVEE